MSDDLELLPLPDLEDLGVGDALDSLDALSDLPQLDDAPTLGEELTQIDEDLTPGSQASQRPDNESPTSGSQASQVTDAEAPTPGSQASQGPDAEQAPPPMLEVLLERVLSAAPLVIVKPAPPTPSPVFDTYLRFLCERMAMYWRRVRNTPIVVGETTTPAGAVWVASKWTRDIILAPYRFTNVYRASDRVSQFLIREVIYNHDLDTVSPADLLFRVLLFKVFNRIDTWVEIVTKLGRYPKRWDVVTIRKILHERSARGEPLYSAAYMMPPPDKAKVKHVAHLAILKQVADDWRALLGASTFEKLYERLHDVPGFGPFLAMQYAVDLNYSPLFDFDERQFIVCGPGAISGVRKCFADFGSYTSEEALVKWTHDQAAWRLEGSDELRGRFEPLHGTREIRGRWPTLIDFQNVFCEVNKYARVAHPEYSGGDGRTKIKQIYTMHPDPLPPPFFPPKWALGDVR